MHGLTITSMHLSPLPWFGDNPGLQTRERRSIATGIGLSLLLHALLLFLSPLRPTTGEVPLSAKVQGPLVVRLVPAAPAPPVLATAPEPARIPEPPPPRRREPVIAVPRKSLRPPPIVEPPAAPTPAPIQPPQPAAAPPVDFLAMLNARRRATEEAAAHANAEARANGHEPSADEIATANINRNLATLSRNRDGTNGIFQILSKGTRTAQFSFRGWTTDANSSWRQVIDVDAGLNGDIELAIVRKMIELIRTHYQGDFNWESHRLGRVVVLSARLEDNAALEAFLLHEFFGA